MKNILPLLFFPFLVSAQNKTAAFETYMKAQAAIYGFNGNVLVSKRGNIIYKRSFGFADYDTKQKLDDSSIFDCGSISKEFTALGILLLKDKGLINYSDTLGKFFPRLPYTHITVQQLLTHTSGMPDGFDLIEKYFDHNKVAGNDDLISMLETKKPALLFKSGEDLMYSGTAFNLLASVIEKLSGQSYKTYMYEQVFKPLGMMHTQVANGQRSAKRIAGLAYGFVYDDSIHKFIRAENLHTGWTSYFAGITGEGMILTTTCDLLKWDRALKNHTLLKEKTQEEMLSVHAQKKFPAVSFGYGMRVGKNEFGDYIFHNGFYPGYLCMHLRYLAEDITIIVLSNNESHAEFIADGLAAITLNKKIMMPYVHKALLLYKIPGEFTGKYMMPFTRPPYMAVFPATFVNSNGTLYIESAFGADIRLVPESDKKFFYANGTDQQIEFETDLNGKLTDVWYVGWGLRQRLKKIE